MSKYFRLIQFLRFAKKETCIKILISLVTIASGFAQAFFLARGISFVLGGEDWKNILLQFAAGVFFLGLQVVFIRFGEGYTKVFAAKLKGGIRQEILTKLLDLGPAYKDDRRTGNLQSLLTDGIESFEPFLTQYLPQVVVVIMTSIFSTTLMWSMDREVGMFVLIMTIVAIIVPHLFMPAVSRVMIEYWRDYAALNAQYIDDMCGMSTLKSLGVSQKEGKRLADMAWEFAKQSLKNLGVSLSDSVIIIACTTAGTAISTVIASYHMAVGLISYSTVLLILFLSRECMRPLYDMNLFWHASYLGLSVAEELFSVLDEPGYIRNGEKDFPSGQEFPKIELKDLSFSYEGNERHALKNVNITMDPGCMTALVGKSGSGKSTIINLLLRFYDFKDGSITVNGVDIKTISCESLRKNISVVFQDTYLFYGTVIENIRIAKPEATDDEVMRAAKMARAHPFIENLPDGYETVVGERGATLSGGEKQRISIARAILKDAPILILDEATSSVDNKNEMYIQEFMQEYMRKKTCIVIAHRLSTVEKADQIFVLDNGTVIEKGTHEQLLDTSELYRDLARTQQYDC